MTSYVYKPGASQQRTRDSVSSGVNIVQLVTGEETDVQNLAIELERLKTTCHSLNQKAMVADDLREENSIMRRRVAELEKMQSSQKIAVDELNDNVHGYQKIREELQVKISQLEKGRVQDEQYIKELERVVTTLEKTKMTQLQEVKLLTSQNMELKNDLEKVMASKGKLQDELDKSTEYII